MKKIASPLFPLQTIISLPKNPEALANNLHHLLKDDDLRIQIANAGHSRIQELTWKRSTDLSEKFLTQHVKV